MAQKVLVVSLKLSISTLGYPVDYGKRDPGSCGGMIWGAEQLHPSLGRPSQLLSWNGGRRSFPTKGDVQEDVCLCLAPSSLEQQLMVFWVGLWTGTGRAAGLLALPTLPEQLFPISSGGKRHRAREKAHAGWVWPADPGWSLLSQPIHAVTALKIICLCKIYVF